MKNASDSLIELKEKGLSGNPSDPYYGEKFKAVQKAASSLLFVDQMEYLVKTLPKEEAQQLLQNDGSDSVMKELEKLTSSEAVERTLYTSPADKMRRLLSDEKSIKSFEKAVSREMKENPAENLVPYGSVVHGAVYKEPGKKGWNRMPGANEQNVKKSLEELKAMSPDNRIFKRISKAEAGIVKEKNSFSNSALNERIKEINKLTSDYPQGSVMNKLGQKAADALSQLKETGLPQDITSASCKKQQEALKNAVTAICAYQRAEDKAEKGNLNIANDPDADKKAEKINELFTNSKLIGAVSSTSKAQTLNELLGNKIASHGLISSIQKEQSIRKDNDIPETAERKGALYRMTPRDEWKEVPGASLKEVNDSLLTVMDEKHSTVLASKQKSKDNIHLSDATLTYGI